MDGFFKRRGKLQESRAGWGWGPSSHGGGHAGSREMVTT